MELTQCPDLSAQTRALKHDLYRLIKPSPRPDPRRVGPWNCPRKVDSESMSTEMHEAPLVLHPLMKVQAARLPELFLDAFFFFGGRVVRQCNFSKPPLHLRTAVGAVITKPETFVSVTLLSMFVAFASCCATSCCATVIADDTDPSSYGDFSREIVTPISANPGSKKQALADLGRLPSVSRGTVQIRLENPFSFDIQLVSRSQVAVGRRRSGKLSYGSPITAGNREKRLCAAFVFRKTAIPDC